MKGTISQGLVLPLNQFERLFEGVNEGDDVTELLCIEKYEPYISVQLQGEIKEQFPHFIPKTDEPRIQIVSEILEIYKGKEFYISEKIDGTSVTFYVYENEFNVCSRNINLKESEENIYWKIARKLDIENKLRSLNKNIAIQGEVWGQGIQGNKYKIIGKQFRVFNIWDNDKFCYLTREERTDLFNRIKILSPKIEHVPVVYEKTQVFDIFSKIEDILYYVNCNSMINTKITKEGSVFKSLDGHIIFKVINNNFLLKEKDE